MILSLPDIFNSKFEQAFSDSVQLKILGAFCISRNVAFSDKGRICEIREILTREKESWLRTLHIRGKRTIFRGYEYVPVFLEEFQSLRNRQKRNRNSAALMNEFCIN